MSQRRFILVLFFTCLTADNPQERAFSGKWQSPLHPIGALLFENLHKVTGIDLFRFSGLDVILVLLLCASISRRPAGGVPLAKGLRVALTTSLLTILWLEAWGIVRGGDFKSSLWQFRQIIWLPPLVYILVRTLRDRRDYAAVAKVIVGAAAVKVALGLYFVLMIVPGLPERERPSFATSHSDSLLFVSAIFIVVATLLQQRNKTNIKWALAVVAWSGVGLVINNRRLAFVGLGAGLYVMYRLLGGATRRRLQRMVLATAPFALLYVYAGRNHGDAWLWKPAAAVASVFTQKDRSSGTRDIENFNLIQTVKLNRLLGSGFGHEYLERVKADNIARTFALYRFIGHNSVLWLLSVAGLFGFCALWMLFAVAAYYGARAFRVARHPRDRAAAEASVAIVTAYIIQAYGDMGLQSWAGVLLLGIAATVAGKLAVAGASQAPTSSSAAVGKAPWSPPTCARRLA